MAVAVVTGTSAVYAVAAVGPAHAAIVMTEGLLGVAILVYAFVRTLRVERREQVDGWEEPDEL